MANYTFTNAYTVNYTTSPAAKEQNSIDFITTGLGTVQVNDNTNGQNFNGNDVVAIGVTIGGTQYYGWISRPIKVGGQVKGFYFWYDPDWVNADPTIYWNNATADGNSDSDGNALDNRGFVLVVDQAYFDGVTSGKAIATVGSSSDRVDSALNSLLVNHAPVAGADTATAQEKGGLNNATTGIDPTGNVLSNDPDSDTGDTKTVTKVGTTAATNTVTGATSSTGTTVTGTYGQLKIGIDGSYSYVVDQTKTESLLGNSVKDIFTYTMTDSHNATSTTTLTVTVNGANDAPVAADDYATARDAASGNVLSNDTDKDALDDKSITGSTGTATTSSISANNTPQFLFTANTTFQPVSNLDYAYYQTGGSGSSATWALIYDVNNNPVYATAGYDATTHSIPLSAVPVKYQGSVGTVNFTGQVVGFKGLTGGATVPPSTDSGNLKNGSLDSIVQSTATIALSTLTETGTIAVGMTVSDSGGAVPAGTKITAITYDGTGKPATLTLDHAISTTNQVTALTFTGSAGSTLTGHYGSLVLNADGSFSYTASNTLTSGTSASDDFSYTMQDAGGLKSSGVLHITVWGVSANDPNAADDTVTAKEKGGTANGTAGIDPTTPNLLTNDVATKGSLTIVAGKTGAASAFTTVTAGTTSANGLSIAGNYGTVTLGADGTYKYVVDNTKTAVEQLNSADTTEANGALADTFVYQVKNGSGLFDWATLKVVIQGQDDAPVAVADTATALEAGGVANGTAGYSPNGNLLANDSDVDNSSITVSTTGTFTGTYGSLTLDDKGNWTYALDDSKATLNAKSSSDTFADTFNYTVTDGTLSTSSTLTINITGANDTFTVSDVFVNEASPYAVFKVSGLASAPVTLALGNTTGLNLPPTKGATDVAADLAADVGSGLEYYDTSASKWTAYSTGATLSVGGELLVRASIKNDGTYEGNEAFTLNVKSSDGTVSRGIGTIGDEGSGDIFLVGNATSKANVSTDTDYPALDDDRPLVSISGGTVAEGGYAVFTASLDHSSTKAIYFTPEVTGGTATVGTDTAAAANLEYLPAGHTPGEATPPWTKVSGSLSFAAGETTVYLRLATTDDNTAESSETFTLGTGYLDGAVRNTVPSGASTNSVSASATITDNDAAGIVLSAISKDTTEAGGTGTFTVALKSSPTSTVTITVASSDTTEGTIDSSTTLTFDSTNWDKAQTVTVKGVDDSALDGDVAYKATVTASSSDAKYDKAADFVAIKNIDDEKGGFVLSAISKDTTEAGGTATFTVALQSAPTSTVTVTLGTSDATEGKIDSTTTLTFDSTNWDKSQTVTVKGVDDSDIDGNIDYTATLAATSSDTNYNKASSSVAVKNIDDDTAGFVLSAISKDTTEAGGTATLTVALKSAPTSTVTVTLGTSDATEGKIDSTTTLTFDSSNWDKSQTVTVKGVDDSDIDGNIDYTATLAATSSDTNYNKASGSVAVKNIDDDSAGFVLSAISKDTTEAGGTATFNVALKSAPTSTVTVTLGTSDATEGKIDSTATLTFDSTNWDKSQTVTVKGVDDHDIDGNIDYTATLLASSTDTNYNKAADSVAVKNIDDDSAGFVLSAISKDTTEAGGTATFTVALKSAPTSTVTVTLGTSDASEGKIDSTTTLTFDSTNWDKSQTVTVKGVDDSDIDGNIDYTATLLASSTDTNYNKAADSVAVKNIDDDTAGFVLSAISKDTTEAGGTATFTVALKSAPTSTVTVTLGTSDATEGKIDSTATLTFDSTNWDKSQTVTVKGVDDHDIDGDIDYTATLAATSSDTNYNKASSSVAVKNIDDDSAGFVLSAISKDTTEAGGTATFTVALKSAPTSTVTVTLGTSDATEGKIDSTATLTFDSTNWDKGQTVTVKGVDDSDIDGNIDYTATLAATSSDTNYNKASGSVAVKNIDDDSAGFVLSAISKDTTEAGGTATFTVALKSAPTSTVTVTLGTSDASEGKIDSTTTLTFDSTNWDKSQSVTVKGVDDHDIDGNIDYTATLLASSTDTNYNKAADSVAVKNIDDDTAGFVLSAISKDTTEAGGTATFTVALKSAPTSVVTVTLDTSDATEGKIDSTTTLTFDGSNWDKSQTVTVKGVDDSDIDGDIDYTATLAATSSDTNYNKGSGSVAVKNIDDDTAGFVLSAISKDTTEAGGTATFTVALKSAPTSTVTVTLGTSDATEGKIDSTATLTFDSTNWDKSQTVTVKGVDDSDIDGNVDYTATLLASSTDANYNKAADSVAVKNIDDDTAGFVLSAISKDTTEAGGTATFTVALKSAPTSTVTVALGTSDATEGKIDSTATLTFDSTNWDKSKTVTVKGVDDSDIDGNIDYTATLLASSTDANYNKAADSVAVKNIDDDSAGLVLSAISKDTTEAGGTATFTVALKSAPTSAVTVTLGTSDATEGKIDSAATLTFDSTNWDKSQTVTVKGVDDSDIDGNIDYTATLLTSSTDTNYNKAADSVAVKNIDDDTAGFVLSAISKDTTEAGGTATFTVALQSAPTSTVTVTLGTSDATEGKIDSTTTLTFDSTNWDKSQTVTVKGVDDHDIDGDIDYTATLLASSTDTNYNKAADSVAVKNIDDDTAGFVLSAISKDTTEAGGTATFTVALKSAPTSTVTVTLDTSDASEGKIDSTTTLTFDSTNWDKSQTVTVKGVDDSDIDGNIDYTATLAATSSDTNYNKASGSVAVKNIDDDSAGFVLSAISKDTTEAGGTATFTVALKSAPTSTVTVTLGTSDATEGKIDSTATLTFDSTNWDKSQTVTVKGVDDHDIDGDIDYTATLAATSSDTNYNKASSSVAVKNIDDDTAGFVLSAISKDTTEAGGTATFTVALKSAPTSTVTVTLGTSDATEGKIDSTTTLTFDSSNWDKSQTVTVKGVDDSDIDGNVDYTATLAATSSDTNYNKASSSVAVKNIDDDSAGFVLSAISKDTTEAGGTATFTVALKSAPTSTVTVTLGTSDATEGKIDSTATLTFDSTNWDKSQTVTVKGVDDHDIDGDIDYTATLAATSSDTNYNKAADSVAVKNIDDDSAGFVLSAISKDTTEAGGTATFTVALKSAPTSAVTVTLGTSDATEGKIDSTTTLTFDSTNWNKSQTVTVKGVDDHDIDGNIDYTATLLASSTDTNYNKAADSVAVKNIDDDSAGFVLSAISKDTTEAGGTATFTVALKSAPTSTVTVTLGTSDASEGKIDSTTTLTFDSTNWDKSQTVTVKGVDDHDIDGDIDYTATLAATSSDTNYNKAADSVAVKNIDDDTAGFLLSAISNDTTEAGGTATFTVALKSAPTSAVTVTLGTSDATEGKIDSTATLTFDSTNWDKSQTVTVKGVDDHDIDGDIDYTATLAAASSDTNYNKASSSVAVKNIDDDTAGFVLSAISKDTTEAGGTATFTVALKSAPTSTVTVTLGTSDASEGKIDSTATLTFDSSNWDKGQTVTVKGVDDSDIDGNIDYTATLAATSSDTNYNKASGSVAVKNIDDDTAGFVLSAISKDTTEAGGTATFTVALKSAPTSAVTVTLGTSDATEGKIDSTATLTFDSTNWDKSQTVTVKGVDDHDIDGDIDYTATLAAASSDTNYNKASSSVAVKNIDDDTAGFVLSAIGKDTTEAGGTATFTVALKSAPTSTVTVTLGTSDATEGKIDSTTTLTFDSTNWDKSQSVTVKGVDDHDIDGNIDYTATLLASSTDTNYNKAADSVAVKNIDDDSAGFVLSAISKDTTEAGGTATFTVALKSAPTSTVTVTLGTSDVTEGKIDSTATLTFDSTNWDKSQTVTVKGVDDSDIDGNIDYTATLAATSSDTNYNKAADSVAVKNIDDDKAALTFGTVTGDTTEAGGTATFTVKLDSAPTSTVTVTLASDDSSEGTVTGGATLTFDNTNWDKAQTVTVTGVDDSVDDGDIGYHVKASAASSDSNYTLAAAGQVTVNNTDDDTAALVVSAISGDTTEAGGTATFTVKLQSAPTSAVTVTVGSDDSTEGSITGGGTLTFDSANWDKAQTVTVAGADDPDIDGTITYHATWGASSSDKNYDTKSGSVAVKNTDDDKAVLVVGAISGGTTEKGGTATFSVHLQARPTSDVTVAVSSDDTSEGTIFAGSSLTFTSANWDKDQTVTVKGVDDILVDGTIGYHANLLSSSTDKNFSGLTGQLAVSNADDDVLGIGVAGSSKVSEGATAVFTVTLSNPSTTDTEVALSLGAGADSAAAADYSSSFDAYYYSGSTKVALTIASGKVSVPAGETVFYVSAATAQDLTYEGVETFSLNAAITAGATATGSASIADDGTGTTFDDKGVTAGGGSNDDTPALSVTGTVGVSEGSHAVFKVALTHPIAADTAVTLTLAAIGDTAASSDYSSSTVAYYYDGLGAKVALAVSGGVLTLPGGVDTFYVSVDTDDDATFEGTETFTLQASTALTGAATGVSGITDDGTGTFRDDKGAIVVGGTPDDDHAAIAVSGTADTSEGGTAVFSVLLSNASATSTEITLALGTGADTADSGDYSSTLTAYYFDTFNVPQTLTVTSNKVNVPAGVTQFYVGVATTADNTYEGLQTFTLAASITGGQADSGTAGVSDDGTGHVYDGKGATTTGPVDNDKPTISVDALLDVSEGSNAIYTVSLSNPSAAVTEIAATLGGLGDTASGTDYSSTFTAYYYLAGVQTAIAIVGGKIQLPAGVTDFFVKVPTTVDNTLEGAETATLTLAITGGASDAATAKVVDNGTGHIYDDKGVATLLPADNDTPPTPPPPPAPAPPPPPPPAPPPFGADLDPASDDGASNTDHVTSVIDPKFEITAPGLLDPGRTVQLIAPDGHIAGSGVVSAADAANGTIDVGVGQLDDGTYTYTARILDSAGNLVAEAPVQVTVVTDLDGVQPSVELAANGGDFNHDGTPDWQQNNVAQLPITSFADYLAGKAAPASSFGAIIAGDVHQSAPAAAVALDASAQLQNLKLEMPAAPLPAGMVQASAVFDFTVTAQEGEVLRDLDASRPGVQTRVVIELPQGVQATGYVKWDPATSTWKPFMDDGNLDTYDNGATLLDLNHDGKVDRVVITLTDGAFGDADGVVNGTIVDPGMLVMAAAASSPVYDVKLANGDHYYSTNATEAAQMSQGAGNVFQGVAFDSLASAQGGRQLTANWNIFTGDWYFAANGDAMPYACYKAMPGAGFYAANEGQGPGADYHLYLNATGLTQLATAAQAAGLGLASQGYADHGAVFNTTASSAFGFDAEGYLVANSSNQAVRDFVHTLSLSYSRTSDTGFIEAVEQDYLARVQLTGVAHGGAAGSADVNAAFGTGFLG